jgi:hypothetical protein
MTHSPSTRTRRPRASVGMAPTTAMTREPPLAPLAAPPADPLAGDALPSPFGASTRSFATVYPDS